ncbi:MAG: CDP-alcohol phosphatidyltransferase family protein [Candidatus Omnitrophica bacterium]|nr:CDP-alcohol phosphatidyltransferase family protein [Candidatus Omnitrophota bacterium]
MIPRKETIAALLANIGISANFLTGLGLVLALASGYFAAQGVLFWAGALILLSGSVDLLDGAVARLTGTSLKPFGGILDSSLDRYGDGFIYGGVALFYAAQGKWLYLILTLSALLGAFAVSYVRARAECEMESCRAGFWERGERLVFLALGLLLNNLNAVIAVLGIATHSTVIARFFCAAKGGNSSVLPASGDGRGSKDYLVKIGILIGIILFFRIR